MQTVDVGAMIVGYNLVIGLLIMLASDKIASYAGKISRRYRDTIVRIMGVSTFTFGSTIAALSAFILIAFHWLKLGT